MALPQSKRAGAAALQVPEGPQGGVTHLPPAPAGAPPVRVAVNAASPGIDFANGAMATGATVAQPDVAAHINALHAREKKLLAAALQHALRPEHNGEVVFMKRKDKQFNLDEWGLEIIDAAETAGGPAGNPTPVPLYVIFIEP